jgi:hypothetical protein
MDPSTTNNNNTNSYIKSDNNILINEKAIKWVKKMHECLEACTKSSGCEITKGNDTHRICKVNSPESYEKLNKHFDK